MVQLLTKHEAAEALRLTPGQVARLASRGELPTVVMPNREVRFDPSDISAWVNSRKRPLAEVRDAD